MAGHPSTTEQRDGQNPQQPSPSQVVEQHRLDLGPYEDTYKHVHQNPELSCQEFQTGALVADHLEKLGYKTHRGIGGHGVVGVLENGSRKVVLLRADMDALPVLEETGLAYASQARTKDDDGREVPVMHACGHDLHVVSLMAAAEVLISSREDWKGTLICLFQPNEERGAGAKSMIDDGLYEKIPKPDILLAQHVLPFKSGVVATRSGPICSEVTTVTIKIYGKGGHGSAPNSCIDPVAIAGYVLVRLQSIVSRSVDPQETVDVTCGSIHGGDSPNVIPEEVCLGLNVRTFNHELHEEVIQRIIQIVKHECAIAYCTREPDIETSTHFPLTSNDEESTRILHEAFTKHFGDNTHTLKHNTASEDFSDLARAVNAPYVYWTFGGVDPEKWDEAQLKKDGKTVHFPGNHSSQFAPVIQPTLKTGVDALSIAALQFLGAGQ